MLAGHRATKRDRGVDNRVERGLGRGPRGVVTRRRTISGCRLPSPAWAIVAICISWRAAIASIRASMAGTFERGTQTSSVSTGPSRSNAG